MQIKLFTKILIANRGEIAVRIIRSAQKMGIKTIAVYSMADSEGMHIRLADEAYSIGNGSLAETYLSIEKIIEVAQNAGAEAIHPGYGFLAENPELVRACEKAGIAFIGPTVEAIRLMGNKVEARAFVEKLGIPMTKAHTGSLKELEKASRSIALPVLVKAAAGGGGKGMRIVRDWSELKSTLEATSREAKAYFGDGEVFVEKYVENPRHIEIQVLGDKYGNVVHLFERECSIQRRYQKVIEESPSPSITPEVREKMGAEAVKIAKAIGYDNAGTIEFLVDKDLNFYFLEMNTRVQVEHPVTEMVTGIDIVREQIRVAAGNPLSFQQADVVQTGHAIEARIYAEDPENNFLPSPGFLTLYQEPKGAGIRIDSGIEKPVEIKSFFDPMISKLIAFDTDRESARKKLLDALEQYTIHGVKTNISYLKSLLDSEAFATNKIDTKFCDEQSEALMQAIETDRNAFSKELLLGAFVMRELQAKQNGNSVWNQIGYWRQKMQLNVLLNQEAFQVQILEKKETAMRLYFNGEMHDVTVLKSDKNKHRVCVDNNCAEVSFSENTEGDTLVGVGGHTFTLSRKDKLVIPDFYEAAVSGEAADFVKSPMPGKLIKVNAQKGMQVAKGDVLLVVEAMKMENNIVAPRDGVVEMVNASEGEMVDGSKILIKLEKKE